MEQHHTKTRVECQSHSNVRRTQRTNRHRPREREEGAVERSKERTFKKRGQVHVCYLLIIFPKGDLLSEGPSGGSYLGVCVRWRDGRRENQPSVHP